MYSLQELEAMAPAETIAIAENMGMKKAGSADIMDVIYYILDNQASTTAKKEASKVSQRQTEVKKQGRRKNVAPKQEVSPKEEESKADVTPAAEENQEVKKKRGRKPKTEKAAEEQVAQTPQAQETQEAQPVVQKKRGRKPNAQKQNAEPEMKKTEDVAPHPEPIPSQGTLVFRHEEKTAPAEEAPQGKENIERRPVATFDSFFGKAKGRTFIPRSQQGAVQEEQPKEAAVPNNQLPAKVQQAKPVADNRPQHFVERPQQIMLQEPGANSQTPKNRDQQKNKKGRQQNRDANSRFPATVLEGKLKVYGVLEIMPEGFGFLRSSDFNYLPSPDDIYISQPQIKQYGLRMGDVVEASVRLPLPDEKYYAMVEPVTINGLEPSKIRDRAKFEHLVPLFPEEKFEITKGSSSNISTRIVDMFAPIGKGQRALIVAPPKTGKTILLKDIANAISENHPETYIIMLLIDERPEEVTDMARSVNAEVIASTFDEPAERHVRIAGIVLEKAKRLVESGHDVVIMLDSITRLARAYNTVSPASGKILSGGVDANALQRPKRFFGAARNIEGGGSLTIIATALTETSSKMDEVIFEEFKGTGNMELQLDRKLSNKRIFPAVDIVASSTRRDDLLLPDETLSRMWVLRNYLADMNSIEAMEFMQKRMNMTRSNEELLVTMDK